jgi:predicted nucleic acid-binding protein
MRLVADTNVLFSFFREDSVTRKMVLNFEVLELFTPSFCVDELRKHKELVCKKSALSGWDFEETLDDLQIFVKVLPHSEYKEFLHDAKSISPDSDDVDFFALAMKLNCAIWSEDVKLKDQSRVKVLSTKELIELLGP